MGLSIRCVLYLLILYFDLFFHCNFIKESKALAKEVGAPIRDGRQAPSKRTARAQAETQRGQRVEEQLLHLC